MPDMKQFELNKVITMLRSFGWETVGSRFEEDKVFVDFDKKVPGAPQTTKEYEDSRITNMMRSMGWNKLGSQMAGDLIHTTWMKVVKSEAP